LVEHELSSQSKSDRYKHPEIDEIYSIYEMSTEKDMPEVIKYKPIKDAEEIVITFVLKSKASTL
jgi:hypothetical protein